MALQRLEISSGQFYSNMIGLPPAHDETGLALALWMPAFDPPAFVFLEGSSDGQTFGPVLVAVKPPAVPVPGPCRWALGPTSKGVIFTLLDPPGAIRLRTDLPQTDVRVFHLVTN